MTTINDLAGREREAANAMAVLAAAEAEYHGAAQRLKQARAAAKKTSGRVHLDRLWTMLAAGGR